MFEAKQDSDRNFEQLSRRLIDRAHADPAACPSRDRLPQPALGQPRDRLQPARDRETRRRRSRCRCCAASATTSRARSPTPACGPGSTARSATSSPGMAYLVRRLLENTANSSFLGRPGRRGAARGAAGGAVSEARNAVAPARFRNEPPLELRRASNRESLGGALSELDRRLPIAVPVLIGGDRRSAEDFASTDPGDPDRVVAFAAEASEAEVEAADRPRRRRRPRVGAPAGRRARRAPDRGGRRCCAGGGSSWRRWRCASAPSRGPRPTPTSARRSTSSSTTRARRSGSRPAPPSPRRRASATRCATSRAASSP